MYAKNAKNESFFWVLDERRLKEWACIKPFVYLTNQCFWTLSLHKLLHLNKVKNHILNHNSI